MRVCQSVGILHPDHLLDVLTQRQLDDWIHFHHWEPWGTPVSDYHAALTTWGGVMGHAKNAVKPEQFLPQWGGTEQQTPESYKQKARAVYARAAAGL